jgi:hypothetical protein
MEFLLLWWDEIDDLAQACRHLAHAAIDETTTLSAPLGLRISALAPWVLSGAILLRS